MQTALTLEHNGQSRSPHAAVPVAGAARPRTTHRRNLLLLLILAIFTLGSGSALAQSSGGATVAVSVRIDTDSAALIKAWRRAQGLDPADAAADAAASALMSGSGAARAGQPASSAGFPDAMTDSTHPTSVNT